MNEGKKQFWQAVKFTLFSVSAGIIQIGSFAVLEIFIKDYWIAYLVSLVLSILWNFTLNRRYTFKSAANVPVAMAKVFGFYLVFTPLSTWWGHLPQIVKSFLAEHDCSGKVVYPFNTHGGSGFASCLSDLSAACPGADIREGLSLLGDEAQTSTAKINAWVSTTV